jgi:hypothetical protein
MDADAMRRAFASQGKADARYIAGLSVGRAEKDTFQTMRDAAMTRPGKDRIIPVFNELARRAATVTQEYSPVTGKILRLSSWLSLITKPAYYFYNLTQPVLMTHPYLAQRFGWGASQRELTRAFRDVLATRSVGPEATLADRFAAFASVENMPADVRTLLRQLASQGKIDITITQDLGNRLQGQAKTRRGRALNLVDRVFMALMQKSEMTNRMVSAVAAYRLARAAGAHAQAATAYAARVVDVTQGDYGNFNAPPWINYNGVTRVLTQFKKFQLIQITYVVNMARAAIGESGMTAAERSAARRAFAFMLAHHGIFAGAMGMPAVGLASLMYAALFGSEDDPRDLEDDLREALGGGVAADLVLKGAPVLLGLDISRNAGMGDMLSMLPYTDIDLTSRSGMERTVSGALGPAVGRVFSAVDALDVMSKGDYARGLELLLPSGMAGPLRAAREARGGITRRSGEVLLDASDLEAMETLGTALGFRSLRANQVTRQTSQRYKREAGWKEHTTAIRRRYHAAAAVHDADAMADARREWAALQAAKVKNGGKASPLSNLLRKPESN